MFSAINKKQNTGKQVRRVLEVIMVLALALYPLRFIHRGLDLWDVGYNYANFQFMGTDSMDPMWLFSTYLATALGHLYTLLPFGETIIGLNFYTGMMVSIIAVSSYIFCTRRLKIPQGAAFIGEFAAISLCWCPTALLYNYLTYLLLLVSVISLYVGLKEGKRRYLYAAGICLGLNVFTRFSNLPEAGLIVAVWAYELMVFIEKIRGDRNSAVKKKERKEFFKHLVFRTFWCVFGYASAVGGMLLYIGIRYGLDNYIAGIKSLFAMTEEASGYSAFSMLYSIFIGYRGNLRWLGLVVAFVFVGSIIVCAGKLADAQFGIVWGKRGIFGKKFSYTGLAYFICVLIAGFMVYLLCVIRLGSGEYSAFGYGAYDEYSFITVPGIVLTMIMILWALGEIFFTRDDINEKLISGLVLLVLLISPIGSNNGLLSVMNNLFLAAPWFVWRLWKLLVREEPYALRMRPFFKENKDKNLFIRRLLLVKSGFSDFPIKIFLIALLGLCFVRFIWFGATFSFTEAHNTRNVHSEIDDDPVFVGIRMSEDKAVAMEGLLNYLNANDIRNGKKLITYGYIPALSFYLQMPSEFNPWVDLASYKYAVMEEQIDKTIESENLPLVIVTPELAKYADGKDDEIEVSEITDRKWLLIMKLLEAGEYKLTYSNDKFAVFVDGR